MELRNAENQVDSLVKSYRTLVRSKVTSSFITQQVDAPTQSLGLEEWNVLLSLVPTTNAKLEAAPAPATATEESSDVQMNVEITISSEDKSEEIIEWMTLTAQQLLININELTAQIDNLEPLASKFRQRMSIKDPVTNQPRYGDKTMNRVITLLQKYDALKIAVDIVNGHNGDGDGEGKRTKALVQNLEEQCNSEVAMAKVQEEEKDKCLKILQEGEEQKRKDDEQNRKQQEFEEELRLKREREELAARAEVARLQRVQRVLEEERAIQAERERERAYVNSVPKGQDGVKAMMKRLRESCEDKKELDTALDALYTLFSQIGAHPEEIKFRRVRRDHPKFMEDIGRHDGGKEVLIAAGFSFAEVDGVKVYFSKEPDLESDMDGWSNWFDLIKATVGIIEEEMIK